VDGAAPTLIVKEVGSTAVILPVTVCAGVLSWALSASTGTAAAMIAKLTNPIKTAKKTVLTLFICSAS
jgi:hypothetical protein